MKYELVKFVDEELELEVNVSPKEETIWLTQEQIVLLFNSTKQNINLHINNILKEEELTLSTVKENLTVRIEGNRKVKRKIKYYNLDMIISVGYRVNSKKGIEFRKWANKVLKEYLIKGYVINENRVVVSNENFNNLLVVVNNIQSNQLNINKRVENLEDKLLDKQLELNKIFYNGQFYDSYTLIQSIFESANNKIIIIDNYIDRSILDRLVVKEKEVNVIIYTNNKTKILNRDIKTFNSQYNGLLIKYTNNVHDRYIIIDKNKLYHLGHSIKDLGKKISTISELESNWINTLITNLSDNYN